MRLQELRTTDLKNLSDFVGGMNHCGDLLEFESYVHATLRELLDADVVAWNEVLLHEDISYASTSPTFGPEFWEDIMLGVVSHLHEHPALVQLQMERPELLNFRISNYLNSRKFYDTGLYNEGYKRMNANYQCGLGINTGQDSYLGIQLFRDSRDFSDREFEITKALIGYVKSKYNLMQLEESLKRSVESFTQNVNKRSIFWISIGPFLYLKNASRNARQILDALFPSESAAFVMPNELKKRMAGFIEDWVKHETPIQNRKEQFQITRESSAFELHFQQADDMNYRLDGFDRAGGGRNSDMGLPNASSPRLSRREMEVFHWIRLGKTNPEIAILMGLQLKTIEKYVSSIFEKFGIHDRGSLITRFAFKS